MAKTSKEEKDKDPVTPDETPAVNQDDSETPDGTIPADSKDDSETPDEETKQAPSPESEVKAPTRGPGAKQISCGHCGWTGTASELKPDKRLKKGHYCPECGRSDRIKSAGE